MVSYRLSPYARFIESKLIADATQHAVFHQLSGQLVEPFEPVLALLLAARSGTEISPSEDELNALGQTGVQIRELIDKQLLIPTDRDPLQPFLNQFVVRPIQSPAVGYLNAASEFVVARTSMRQFEYSPNRNQRPRVIEEILPADAARIFLMADGTQTLGEIFINLTGDEKNSLLEQSSFRETINFLTHPERQLIKFSDTRDNLDDPFKPCNMAPRNLYHVAKWPSEPASGEAHHLDFHRQGIEDALWEFDFVEPTINHALRFPSEALGGYEYGARFCLAALKTEVVSSFGAASEFSVLEVGGGTGSFARAFIDQANKLEASGTGPSLSYNILELSPALARQQRELLAQHGFAIDHFEQDATSFNLAGRKFDLIVANEVIADFPVAKVRRVVNAGEKEKWEGEGARYLEKYDLDEPGAPDSFIVNSGVFDFLERAREHLLPGGAIIMSEYGSGEGYPGQAHILNHEEFSINFRHVKTCARKIGLDCRLVSLRDFLEVDDDVLMLSGMTEHIHVLNHVLGSHHKPLPFAAISKTEFEARLGDLPAKIGLMGFSFSPLRANFHYGPDLDKFIVAVIKSI